MIIQVQRYINAAPNQCTLVPLSLLHIFLCSENSFTVSLTFSSLLSLCFRATDKARSILKECSDNLTQAVSSLPLTDHAALARQARTSSEEAMDTSRPAVTNAVSPLFLPSSNGVNAYILCPGSIPATWFQGRFNLFYGECTGCRTLWTHRPAHWHIALIVIIFL